MIFSAARLHGHASSRSDLIRPVAKLTMRRRGPGSSVQHWWAERVAAVALVPLCLWFAASIIAHAGNDRAVFIGWIRTPLATSCMTLLPIALFHHSALGLQVVI